MKTRILSMVLIAVFAISTTAMAQSHEGRKKNPEQKEMMMKRHKQMKDRYQHFFTEEQQEKMKELRIETAKKVKPLKNELNELQARQQTLTTANKADLNAINDNIDKMSKTRGDIQKAMAKRQQDVRAMLNDEQLIKFDAMKNRKGMRGKGFHNKGMEGHQKEHSRRG